MLVRCAFGAKRFVQAETWTNVPDSLAVACAVLSALEVRAADGESAEDSGHYSTCLHSSV